MKTLAIDLIITDAGTQMRAGTRLETVKEYAEIAASRTWDFASPVVVFTDGKLYWLADGFHRVEGCKLAGRASVQADVRKGTLRDAIKFALGANVSHGLRRSNEDKRRCVEFVLNDAEWSKMSSRAIADMCGVSDMFVGGIRKDRQLASDASSDRGQLQTACSSNSENTVKNDVSEKRIGRDGKERPATVTKKSAPVDDYEDVPDDEPAEVPAGDARLETAAMIAAASRDLDVVVRKLKTLADRDGGEWLALEIQQLQQDVRVLKSSINATVFWRECPMCKNGCKECQGIGWLSRDCQRRLSREAQAAIGAA